MKEKVVGFTLVNSSKELYNGKIYSKEGTCKGVYTQYGKPKDLQVTPVYIKI